MLYRIDTEEINPMIIKIHASVGTTSGHVLAYEPTQKYLKKIILNYNKYILVNLIFFLVKFIINHCNFKRE